MQIFFNSIDIVKSKMYRRSFLDYDDFKEIFYDLIEEVDYVKRNNVKVPEHVCGSLFSLLDTDDSGTLEPAEVIEFNRNIMGKPKDQQAKEDLAKKLEDYKKKARAFIKGMTGIQI